MQGIISFNGDESNKRRKALRACQRCKDAKKRCILGTGSAGCKRCIDDGWACSFLDSRSRGRDELHLRLRASPDRLTRGELTEGSTRPLSPAEPHHAPRDSLDTAASQNRAGHAAYRSSDALLSGQAARDGEIPSTAASLPPAAGSHTSSSVDQWDGGELHPALANESAPKNEMRYATMLSLMNQRQQRSEGAAAAAFTNQPTKLISGTNPLSALLGRELKHKIVTNSCSFRTPDPINSNIHRVARHRGGSLHSCDWLQFYRDTGVSEARLQYLQAMNAFKLPSPAHCAMLLEIYFFYVHPMMPVIDRGNFLSMYYGGGDAPSLVLLYAVFLAASRYATNTGHSADGVSELRGYCDDLHARLRALLEAEITSDRVAVVQASILASLHWEGREGLNSAIDNLGIAVRGCQDLGLHRKQYAQTNIQGREQLLRRLWWCLYALDRFMAAQEGTPFLVNELDCDVEMLTEEDLSGEDELTRSVTLLSIQLATTIEDVVRSLYTPGENHTTLCTNRGVATRNKLDLQLEHLAQNINRKLPSDRDSTKKALKDDVDRTLLFGDLLHTHLDAVRILLHRPFILYLEPRSLGGYGSRNACRLHATEIVSRLELLSSRDMLRFSWPFTVYAVVNCLLIFWYDISAPLSQDRGLLREAWQSYTSVVRLLRTMGTTWWAAAAKYHLAQSLAHAADELNPRPAHVEVAGADAAMPAGTGDDMHNTAQEYLLTPLSGTYSHANMGSVDWADGDMFADSNNADYWGSIGLDFDLDVVENIFSISNL